jgi:hypothetical protein
MQLVKVDGDVNPADIFTKHSLSRDRLVKLMKLYDCKYTSGRAASAPQTRGGAEGKLTMADADEVYAADEEVRDPDMPHLRLSEELLESLHPALVISPDQHDEPDLRDDDEDGIIVEGERIIKQIISEAQAHGRRRRSAKATTTTTTTTRAAEACPGSDGPRSTATATARAAEACPGSAGPARQGAKGGVSRGAQLEALALPRDAASRCRSCSASSTEFLSRFSLNVSHDWAVAVPRICKHFSDF